MHFDRLDLRDIVIMPFQTLEAGDAPREIQDRDVSRLKKALNLRKQRMRQISKCGVQEQGTGSSLQTRNEKHVEPPSDCTRLKNSNTCVKQVAGLTGAAEASGKSQGHDIGSQTLEGARIALLGMQKRLDERFPRKHVVELACSTSPNMQSQDILVPSYRLSINAEVESCSRISSSTRSLKLSVAVGRQMHAVDGASSRVTGCSNSRVSGCSKESVQTSSPQNSAGIRGQLRAISGSLSNQPLQYREANGSRLVPSSSRLQNPREDWCPADLEPLLSLNMLDDVSNAFIPLHGYGTTRN